MARDGGWRRNVAKPSDTAAEEIEIASAEALHDWLSRNHARDAGVWIVIGKKAAGARYLPVGEVIRACLAWGWVDSMSRGKDELHTMLRIAPRRAGSAWSRINKDHVAALQAQGAMRAPGAAAVARAMQDGSWSALDEVEAGLVPPDLAAALAAQPGLRETWDGYPRSVIRTALERLATAKTQATRDKRLQLIVEAAAAGRRPFQRDGG